MEISVHINTMREILAGNIDGELLVRETVYFIVQPPLVGLSPRASE